MPTLRTEYPVSPALRFITVLFLSAAVFALGLQVKLSHYSNSPGPEKIAAKLVQDCRGDKELNAKGFSALQAARDRAHLLSAEIYIALIAPIHLTKENRLTPTPATPSFAACPPAIFSRPPPQNA